MKKVNANKQSLRLRLKQSIKDLPDYSGVYLFSDKNGKVIYVGKAKNLKNRVGSYFNQNLELKTRRMVQSATYINFIPVELEFEALLLEAKLVRKYKPKYNIELRDDKSPLYIGITREDLPRIVLLRQRELDKKKLREVFGPFINTSAPKWVLRTIRKIFPYSSHKPGKRACVNSQIGLCNPCPSDVTKNHELKKEYMLNVRRVKAILSGRSSAVVSQLEREMKDYAKSENFEKARETKEKLEALIYTMTRKELNREYLENPNLLFDIRAGEQESLRKFISRFYEIDSVKRIECYDVSHFAGTYPTASMVTFVNGEPDKTLYRHFKIKGKKGNSDVDSMREVLRRRKKYFDEPPSLVASASRWGKPDLIIVDGGKGQLAAAEDVMAGEVPVVGLAKREETLVFKTVEGFHELRLPEGPAKKLVQRIRDEAHRFARRYHHKLVSRAISEA